MAVIDPHCRGIAAKAAGGKLSEADIVDAFARIEQHRLQLEADGKGTGRAERMRKWAAEEGERTKIAAAMQRRHAALNAIVRDRIDRQLSGMIGAGVAPHKALRAILEGINSHAPGSRASVDATTQAYEARYLGGMFADLEAERPHLVYALADEKLDQDLLVEMWELRKDGKPGSTGNDDAKWLARRFADYAELSRTDLNRLGASIGKLDGWAGVQTHDPMRMIGAGKEVWVGRIVPLLDIERTFPEGVTQQGAMEILGDVYDTLITGLPNRAGAVERGQRVNPANLAKSLGKSRVLHFVDAQAALAYRDEFGYGNTIAGMFSHLRHVAKLAGTMETLGPNPEVMFRAVAARLQRDIRNSRTIPDKEKTKLIGKLNTEAGALRHALDVATGLVSRPVNMNAAKIGSDIRAMQSMAKLGAALFSSLNDTSVAATAAAFRGSNFFTSLTRQIAGVMQGRPRGQQAEFSYMLGEGIDGMLGHIAANGYAVDGPVGALSKMQAGFFKWNGLSWWTDVNRSVAARTIAAELGMRSGTPYDDLPPAFRHVLSTADIDAQTWEVLGKVALRMDNGKPYLTPDRVRELADEDIAPLAAERIQAIQDAAEKAGPNSRAAQTAEERIAGIIADERRRLELKMLSYVADQTSYAVLETDARTRRYTTQGQRPGTTAGEVVRFLMQFKGYPLAFTTRTFGRALFGHRKDASMLERSAHIGQLIAGLTIMGYMSMVAKDMLKGYWPPRNPGDYRTILAAFQQGGAWGIYGDFLFSDVNRFGGGVVETALGPSIGSIGDLANIALQARNTALSGGEENFSGSRAFSTVLATTPYANLHVLKPAMDYLIVNSIREAISPGYMRKQARTRMTEYGQQALPSLIGAPPALDPLNIAGAF